MQIDLTQGNIRRSLVLFSLPMILGNLLQQLYNVADTLIVGKTIGTTALSAVGSAYALMVLLTSIMLGLCMGSGVVFAQHYGARRIDDLKLSMVNAFLFILGITILLTIVSFYLLDHFIHQLRLSPAVLLRRISEAFYSLVFLNMLFITKSLLLSFFRCQSYLAFQILSLHIHASFIDKVPQKWYHRTSKWGVNA